MFADAYITEYTDAFSFFYFMI